MKKKPYLTDAIIGNSKILATLNKDGEIVRMWWPQITFPQHIDVSYGGVFVEGRTQRTVWLNNKDLSKEQNYIEDTNVLSTKATSKKNAFSVETADYVIKDADTLVRRYRIYNNGNTPDKFRFLYYTSFQSHDSKLYASMYFDYERDALVYFKHRYSFAIGSMEEVTEFTTKDTYKDAMDGNLDGVDEFMTHDGALAFDLGIIEPSTYKEISILISAGEGRAEALAELSRIKQNSANKLLEDIINYWHRHLEKGRAINLKNKKIEEIYKRSLLAFKLLTDERHGAIAAAPEVDEAFEKCGGYGFCWGRDAAYICSAFDKAGYTEMSKDFFKWSKRIQEKDGSFNQRYHIDGRLAPVWGMQIDETAAIVFGIYKHYETTKDIEFLKDMWDTVNKASEFVLGFIDEETGLPKPSMDLWEERKGEHIYSAAAVYGGFKSAASIAKELSFDELAEKYLKAAEDIKIAIAKHGIKDKVFLRTVKREVSKAAYEKLIKQDKKVAVEDGKKGYKKYYQFEDAVIDISLLGVSEPFEVFEAEEESVRETARLIEEKLWTPFVGGIKRYEDDNYIGGNPWILTTLWLALYKSRIADYDGAIKLLEWASEHATEISLLPEQVDKTSGRPAWIIPLTWSHAMFVLVVLDLYDKGILS